MKSIILILLASVVVSLFSGLFFLVKDRDSPDSTRMLTSLKIRVVLSICLVVFLVGSYRFQPAPISSNRALRSAPLAGR
jgi:hypothetical protein